MIRQLIVNADDFGLTPGVSAGIIRAHLSGIVTSTTVMINLPFAAHALEIALRDAPDLGIGLHLNLTAGTPVSPGHAVTTLTDTSGRFHSRDAFLGRLQTLDKDEVLCEIQAQYDRYVALTGLRPDHLDAHHHCLYLSPALFEILIAFARDKSIPMRNPVVEAVPETEVFLSENGLTNAATSAEDIHNMAMRSGLVYPDHFVRNFYAKNATLGGVLNLLVDLPAGVTELMCHPGEVDSILEEASSYVGERVRELEILTHRSVREVMSVEGVQPITFSALSPA